MNDNKPHRIHRQKTWLEIDPNTTSTYVFMPRNSPESKPNITHTESASVSGMMINVDFGPDEEIIGIEILGAKPKFNQEQAIKFSAPPK